MRDCALQISRLTDFGSHSLLRSWNENAWNVDVLRIGNRPKRAPCTVGKIRPTSFTSGWSKYRSDASVPLALQLRAALATFVNPCSTKAGPRCQSCRFILRSDESMGGPRSARAAPVAGLWPSTTTRQMTLLIRARQLLNSRGFLSASAPFW
jgi:hypothetical protein